MGKDRHESGICKVGISAHVHIPRLWLVSVTPSAVAMKAIGWLWRG